VTKPWRRERERETHTHTHTKKKLRTVVMDADAVPVFTAEGKRRSIILTGAKEVADYVKTVETVIKASS
jgi:hypothetical protein